MGPSREVAGSCYKYVDREGRIMAGTRTIILGLLLLMSGTAHAAAPMTCKQFLANLTQSSRAVTGTPVRYRPGDEPGFIRVDFVQAVEMSVACEGDDFDQFTAISGASIEKDAETRTRWMDVTMNFAIRSAGFSEAETAALRDRLVTKAASDNDGMAEITARDWYLEFDMTKLHVAFRMRPPVE